MKTFFASLILCGVLTGCADMSPEQRAAWANALGNMGQQMQQIDRDNRQRYYDSINNQPRPINCTTIPIGGGDKYSTTCW